MRHGTPVATSVVSVVSVVPCVVPCIARHVRGLDAGREVEAAQCYVRIQRRLEIGWYFAMEVEAALWAVAVGCGHGP